MAHSTGAIGSNFIPENNTTVSNKFLKNEKEYQ